MRGPRFAAEATGTFMLVFIGPGALAVNARFPGAVPPTGVALAFGFAILAGVYALGPVSGGHFNPAVSLGFWATRRLPTPDFLGYVAVQLAGATAAAFLLRAVLGGDAARAAVTVPAIGPVSAVVVEGVLTFFLMLVIVAVATDSRVAGAASGLAIGLTIAFDALMGGALTGASMNPARSFGPALAAGVWRAHWVYWLGPALGATLAVTLYAYLRKGSAHGH